MLQTIISYLLLLIVINGCNENIDVCHSANEPTSSKKRGGNTSKEFSITKRNNILKNMKERENIADRVKNIVVKNLGLDDYADEVVDDSNFIDDLGADSLDTVELLMALEEAFNIEIPNEEAEGIATVGDAVKFIEEKSS